MIAVHGTTPGNLDAQPIPDEFVDWFVSFLRGMEADNESRE